MPKEAEEPFFLSGPARFFRDDDPEGFRQSPGTAVEQLVMEGAEAKAVRLFGRAAGLVPFDVRRLDADRGEAELQTEIAHTAPILVCTKDPMTEFGISPLPNNSISIYIYSHIYIRIRAEQTFEAGFKDEIIVIRFGEVSCKNRCGDIPDKLRIFLQCIVYIRRETS